VRKSAWALTGVVVLGISVASRSERSRSPCPLEQEWQAGGVYDWEWLELSRNGKGIWTQGDRHGTEYELAFRWRRDGDVLVVRTSSREERRVRFHIARRDESCVLSFDDAPLEGARTEYYGRPN
jgi:hypothetical protein